MSSYCTIEYDGSKAPRHLAGGFTLKGRFYGSGIAHEVDAKTAGLMIASVAKGLIKVINGTPEKVEILSRSAKEARRRALEKAAMFPSDPARALDGTPTIPSAILKACAGKKGPAAVAAGEADAMLGEVAIWAKLGGKDDLAAAAARRLAELAE